MTALAASNTFGRMQIVERLGQAISTGSSNFVRTAWDRLSPLPFGKRAFSELVGRAAPYTGTIGARVEEVREQHARVSMPDTRGNRNHLECLHAVALVNLAELAGNLALAYTMPDDARFIVAGLSIEYLKKARGTVVAEGTCPAIADASRRELEVAVSIRDRAGDEVARATLRTLVGPKKR